MLAAQDQSEAVRSALMGSRCARITAMSGEDVLGVALLGHCIKLTISFVVVCMLRISRNSLREQLKSHKYFKTRIHT